jgi:1-acyl-sn-glycerol-3-phosphate acyltransferase
MDRFWQLCRDMLSYFSNIYGILQLNGPDDRCCNAGQAASNHDTDGGSHNLSNQDSIKEPNTSKPHKAPAPSSGHAPSAGRAPSAVHAPDTDESRYPIARGFIGNLAFYVSKTASKLALRLQVRGQENIPDKIPYVIAANHETYVDGMWIGAFLPKGHFRHMASLTAKDLEDQHGWLGRIIVKVARGIAVDRFGNPVRGLIIAKKKVEEGNILLVHPEGTRSIDGQLGELKDGAAYIAMKSKVPLVPVFIDGGYEVFSRHMKWPQTTDPATHQRRRVIINYGKPLYPKDFANAHEMTAALIDWMNQMYANKQVPRALLPPVK